MPPLLNDLLFRLRSLFRRRAVEGELDEELRFHLEQSVEKYVNSGLSREEALRRARLEFGGIERAKEECRDARGARLLETIWQDTRYATRMLRKFPGFVSVVVLTIAFGIGATVSVFSVVDRILFRSLPYTEDNRLVSFGLLAPIEQDEFMFGSDYVDFKKQFGLFKTVTAIAPGTIACDLTEQDAVRLDCVSVEQTFL